MLRFNGKEMKDAVLKTDQFEIRVLEFTPDHVKLNVKASGRSFNFIPRLLEVAYPDKTITAIDSGSTAVPAGGAVDLVIHFQAPLRIEPFLTMELRYSRKKLAEIEVEA